MRRTCFVCYGAGGKKNSLTYHELSRKTDGDEFFLFLSWSRPEHEAYLGDLYRRVVSSSRLGHPSRFFRELVETASSGGGGSDESSLEETCILMVWRKGNEVFLLRNNTIEPIHFDSRYGTEGTMQSLEGRIEVGLVRNGSQADLFKKRAGDNFRLDKFRLSTGAHTILFAPSRDFVRRNRDALLDSVLFPSFEVPPEGELEVDSDLSLGAMHWETGDESVVLPKREKRGVEIMKASVPLAAGALALILAILLIFNPFGGNGDGSKDNDDILLSTGEQVDSGVGGDQAPASGSGADETPAGSAEEVGNGSVGKKAGSTLDTSDHVSLADGWKKKFGGPVTSSPVVCSGAVTFGCRDKHLYCFDLDGAIRWKYAASDGIGATPACAVGFVVGADYGGNVFCLRADNGSRVWNYMAGAKVVSSPVIRGEMVFACTMDGRIICLGLEGGDRKWSQKIGEGIWATPAVGGDYIVVASTDGSLVRMTQGGRVVWRVAPGGEIYSSPLCLEKKDLVIIGTGDRYVLGYSLSSGALMWRYAAGSDVRSSPITSGEMIVVGTEDGVLISLDRNGVMIWKKDLGGPIRSKPLNLGEMIAVTSYSAKLYIISASDGDIVAEYTADSPIYSSPAFYGNRLYFGSNGGFLYAPELRTAGG